ncbi:hypothetical protein CNMCM6936_008018 [Aspergillus lentulus]|nr:hypothetical protein CNMCM6936_008018 [Aspergillus lentulus]
MRFSALTSLLALGAFTGVLATPTKVSRAPSLVERDFAAVTSVVAAISSKVDALDANIKAYSGGDTSAIVGASADLISTINDGTSMVAAQPALSQADALNLVNPILALTGKVKTTINDLISKKSLIVEAGAGPTTYNQLLAQYTASSNLATTLAVFWNHLGHPDGYRCLQGCGHPPDHYYFADFHTSYDYPYDYPYDYLYDYPY